jgi:hypothetical protein
LTVHVELETRVGSRDVTFQEPKSDGVELIATLGVESVALNGRTGRGHAVDAAPVGSAYPISLEEKKPFNPVEDRNPNDEVDTTRLIDVTVEVPVVEAVTLV